MLIANGTKLNTFTAVPEAGFTREELRGRYFDEAKYCRQIAKTNGNIVPHFIPPNKISVLQQIAQEIRLGGFSGGILNGLWVMDILAAARSAGHDVMLSGEMGNFTMSYHGRQLFTELLLRGRWLKLLSEIRSAGDRWTDRVRLYVVAPLIPGLLFRSYRRWRRGGKPPWYDFSLINPEFAHKSGVVDRAAHEYLPFDTTAPREFKLSRINDLHCYAETADWYANVRAGFGIDFRTPAYDRRLVEFCFGIPQDQYLRGGCERWLIRRAMKGRLPESVLSNKKFGAQAADWYSRLTRERHHLMEEITRFAANANVASIVDLKRLSAILNNWPNCQPPEYTSQEQQMLAVPEALGAAYFIENVMGRNFGR
jgi:asparagine synthase (glutamine-hydrolysing)